MPEHSNTHAGTLAEARSWLHQLPHPVVWVLIALAWMASLSIIAAAGQTMVSRVV